MMLKKCAAIILAVCVFWIGIPVYAGSENVTKEVIDMTGLQMFWESEEPNDAGQSELYSLQINPVEGKPKRFFLHYQIDYLDEEGFNSGYRIFTADIPDGEFAFKNNAGDTLDFSATLKGFMESMDYPDDDDGGDEEEKYKTMTDDGEDEWPEPVVTEETIHFDLHAVIYDQTKVMMEQHTKTADAKRNMKFRGSSWPIAVSGCIDDMQIQDIEGNLSTMTIASMSIGKVEPEPEPGPEPEPEPEPELKSAALDAKGKPTTSGKPDVMKNEIFQIRASAGGMKEFEYYFSEEDYVYGMASYYWGFDIQLSGDVYVIIITYQFAGVPEIERTFTTRIPASDIVIPSGFTGALTLDLELFGDVDEHQVIWHQVEIDGERFEEMEETFETFSDVPLNLHLVLDTVEASSTRSILKVKTEGFKGMQSGSTIGYSGLPSGTVEGNDIGEGFYAEITIGQSTERTKGEMVG